MKHSRIFGFLLMLVLTVCLLPGLFVKAEAVTGIDELTCSGFISNADHRNYIDTMMKYYFDNNSKLITALDNGKSVIFMFEGGSDNYPSNAYEDSAYDTRTQAVCIVIQKNSSGKATIVFYSENCSSLPDDPDDCTGAAYSGATTLMDGIYGVQTTNHTGPYGALNTYATTGYYTPPNNQNGYTNGAGGINVHTRTSAGSGGGWSLGCQVIGYGNSSANEFNAFMKAVAGINYNVWVTYKSALYTLSGSNLYKDVGYYVLDRQLGTVNASGVSYGSGSLIEMYNSTALKNITAWSTTAKNNASWDYTSKCTPYPSYCEIEITSDTPMNTMPRSVSAEDKSETVENVTAGTTLTATKLYQNSFGNYWYQVKSSSGDVGYVYAGDTKFVKLLTSDIKLSGATAPNGHVAGSVFAVNGTIKSSYNRLDTAAVAIRSGFGTAGTQVTGGSDSVSGNAYALVNSSIDYATAFNEISAGKYTYVISASYTNYYATDATTITKNTGTVNLMTEYFMVISAAADQASCAHSYSTTIIKAATCTSDGTQAKSCAKCGKVISETVKGSHSYTSTSVSTTCERIGYTKYTCSKCSDTYSVYDESVLTGWSTTKPAGVSDDRIITKTQYRSAEKETITSYNASEPGYTQERSGWDAGTAGSVQYVKSWPSGFSTSNSLYSKYNVSPKTASETAAQKVTVNSDSVTGYLYYHWCYANSYYSAATKQGSYTTFHAYYSTTNPSSYNHDTSDDSYCTASASCANTEWWFVAQVNTQKYTTYKKQYTHYKWGEWSDWSDTAVTASGSQQVETRTLYRALDQSKVTHSFTAQTVKGDCQNLGYTQYTCGTCGYSYREYAGYSEWSATAPTGVDADRVQTKTQYRYADKEIKNTYNSSESGYTQTGKAWDSGTAGTVKYVKNWPTGFKTDHSLYTQYHKTPVTASVTDTQKITVNSNTVTGYLYYHWCDTSTTASNANNVGVFNTFHAYYDTTAPGNYACDTSDMSYKTGRTDVCSNSNWFLAVEVTTQKYTTYKMLYTHEKWGYWSDWSDSVSVDSDNRKVETRTMYRYATAAFGDHSYTDGVCGICGASDPSYVAPVTDYYLVGYINGADYGCESDYQNMGQYKFVNGKLTVTFDEDSYVFLKTTDNSAWYMTETYVTGTSANYYNTLTGASEKMFVPGGKEITFTLVENGDDSLTLSYVAREETVTPTGTVEPKSATLSLEDEVLINLYFIVEEMEATPDSVGMLIYNQKPETANVATADIVIEGGLYNESNGRYMVSTPGIPGQYLADSLYLVAYAKDANGHYVYARTVEYSGKKYCTSQMTKGTAELKAICVALMNYGAAAQQYFAATTDYTYDTLMNVEFAQYQNLVKAYSSDMLAARGTVDSAKAGTLGTTVNGFTKRSVSMSADGDFSLNYYLTTDKAVDKVTFYYWTAEQYASVSKLTLQNASGSKEMVLTDGTNRYWANVSGIAAKDIDQTVYACGVYEVDGVTYTSGVFSYSIGYYCTSKAAGTDETVKPFAKAIAVYSYHARIFLDTLN